MGDVMKTNDTANRSVIPSSLFGSRSAPFRHATKSLLPQVLTTFKRFRDRTSTIAQSSYTTLYALDLFYLSSDDSNVGKKKPFVLFPNWAKICRLLVHSKNTEILL